MIGKKLEDLLKVKKMKPAQLASKIDVNKATIYSIIKRDSKRVNLSIIEKIADVLEVPIEYFLDKEEPKNEETPIPVDEDELEEFVRLFDQLTDDQKKFILSSMKGILAEK